MLHDVSQHKDDGIQLKYRTDGGVFNFKRLKTNTNVKVATLRELMFADDYALNSNSESEMQQGMNLKVPLMPRVKHIYMYFLAFERLPLEIVHNSPQNISH